MSGCSRAWPRTLGLPWDVVLGAETARAYKPQPQAYLASAELLNLAPGQVMLVAAHNGDLAAAAKVGLATAFVARPTEYGPHQSRDFKADRDWDVVTDSFTAPRQGDGVLTIATPLPLAGRGRGWGVHRDGPGQEATLVLHLHPTPNPSPSRGGDRLAFDAMEETNAPTNPIRY